MILKPQDIVILLKIVTLQGQPWTVRSLASQVFISHSEVFAGLKRLTAARLVNPLDSTPHTRATGDLLIHSVRYVFPPDRGGLMRGMPTSYAAPPFCALISSSAAPRPAASDGRSAWVFFFAPLQDRAGSRSA